MDRIGVKVSPEPLHGPSAGDRPTCADGTYAADEPGARWKGPARSAAFFSLVALLAGLLGVLIDAGLRRIRTSEQGMVNSVMQGRVSADLVITGSSRATAHYDPRIIQAVTGLSAFNLG